MTAKVDCVKWLLANGWRRISDESWVITRPDGTSDYIDVDLAGLLHDFSATTVGHSWVDQSFRAEEERQKAVADLSGQVVKLPVMQAIVSDNG